MTFDTRTSLSRDIEADRGLAHGACTFERVEVVRLGRSDGTKVECLIIKGEATLTTQKSALGVIARWRSIESLDYYRVATSDNGGIIFVDLATRTGYWRRDRKDEGIDLVRPRFSRPP